MNIFLKKLLLLSAFFTVEFVHSNTVMQQIEKNIVTFTNNKMLAQGELSDCVGLLFEQSQIFTSTSCISLISSSSVSSDENSIKFFALNNSLPINFKIKNNQNDQPFIKPNSFDDMAFYIYSVLEEKWVLVNVMPLDRKLFYFSFSDGIDRTIKLGSPLIDQKGRLLCLNKGEKYCERPSEYIKIEEQISNSNCTIARDPFPCQDTIWSTCDIEEKVGIGECFRQYDHAKCNITLTGHSLSMTGTISCKDCNAFWEEKNNQISDDFDTPSGCMTHHVSDWRMPFFKVGSVLTGVAILAIVVFISYSAYKKSRTSAYSQI